MKKTKRIEVRFTEDEYIQLKQKADESNRPISEIVRESVTRVRTWTAKDKKIQKEKLRQLSNIGNNLNQMARWCNTYKSGAEGFQITSQLKVMQNELGWLYANKTS